MRNSPLVAFFFVLTTACAACGDDGPAVDVTPPPASPGAGVQIRGTERLGWDQPAASYQQVRQYAFNIYIDGTRTSLPGVECLDSQAASGFPCAVRVPQMANGTHTIELAAVIDGRESPRSSPLIVTMTQGRMVVGAQADAAGLPGEGSQQPLFCLDSQCFSLRHEITRPVSLSSPALLPDGRLLFVEDGRGIWMVKDGLLLGGTAFGAGTGSSSRVTGLLVDADYERSRLLRVAWIEDKPNGRSFGITRLRESNNRFGEEAVIVPALPLPAAGTPRVAQDGQGRMYVAVPGGSGADTASSVYSGTILRFSPDGATWTAGLGSPIFAVGFTDPLAMSVESAGRRLWVAGSNGRGESLLKDITLADSPDGQTVSSPAQQSVRDITTEPRATALAPLLTSGSSGATFVGADEQGALIWLRGDRPGVAAGRSVLEGRRVLAVHASRGHVLLTTADAESGLYSIFRIVAEARR